MQLLTPRQIKIKHSLTGCFFCLCLHATTMKMKKILFLALVFYSLLAKAQQRYENEAFGFSMMEPKGWIYANSADQEANLMKLDLTDEQLKEILDRHKGSVHIQSFYKYDPQTHEGLVPAIQINAREKKNDDYDRFKTYIVASALNFKNIYPDYELIDEPREIKISHIKSIYFCGKFTMKTQTGQEYRVRSRVYVIPYRQYYFQLTFTDSVIGEDCSAEFEKLLKTIKISKKR